MVAKAGLVNDPCPALRPDNPGGQLAYRSRRYDLRVVRVQIVAAVVFGLDVAGPRRIARQRVEVDDAVELAARADPVVDRRADLLLVRVIVALERAALERFLERRQRRPEDTQPMGVGPLDELMVTVGDVLRGRLLGVRVENRLPARSRSRAPPARLTRSLLPAPAEASGPRARAADPLRSSGQTERQGRVRSGPG